MISTFLELAGAVALVAAAFTVSMTAGMIVAGIASIAVVVLIERHGH